MKFHIPRRAGVAVLAAVLSLLIFSAVAWALSRRADNLGSYRRRKRHCAFQYCFTTQNSHPTFIAWVDRVYYGGRKPSTTFLLECCGQWRRNNTVYREWNGSSWVTAVSFGSSSWRATGNPGLAYWNVNNDVTLEGGALVKNRLRYKKYVTLAKDWVRVLRTLPQSLP